MNRSKTAWALVLAMLASGLASCERGQTTYMVGTLERDRIDIIVESNEPIAVIQARDGQSVEAGELILAQDQERAAARLAQRTAQRDQAAARLAELRRGPRQELIREAEARLTASRARASNADARYRRTREVFEKGLSSQGRLDADEAEYLAANAQAAADSEALERLLNGTTIEELDQAVAALQAAEAQLRQAQLDLERTHVRAPVAGVVDKVLYRVGERPAPGTTVAIVLDSARTYARVYVPEHLRARVRPGRRIGVRIDGIDSAFEGTVRWVSADASFTPYFALTEHDRSRLSYLAEIDIPAASELPSGVPLQADFPRD
jgi:HlyD family secretion protein